MVILGAFLSVNIVILDIFSPKMTIVRPKTIPWRSNQMLRSICMDTVLQNSHDDKLTISMITLASACSYGHKNKISISSRIHIGGMAPVYHSHSPHTVG